MKRPPPEIACLMGIYYSGAMMGSLKAPHLRVGVGLAVPWSAYCVCLSIRHKKVEESTTSRCFHIENNQQNCPSL